MSGFGRQDGFDGSDEPVRRDQNPYIAPPHIRTTGEVPAVTGEVPPPQRPYPYGDPDRIQSGGSDDLGDRWSLGGSVVDRPPPTPPDWMSGVQVPELLVTRDIDRSELARPPRRGFVDVAQRVLGLVLVALLVAIVALVLATSVLGF